MRQPSYATTEAAINRGKALGISAVLYGEVPRFESSPKGAVLDMQVKLISVPDARVILDRHYTRSITSGLLSQATVQERMGSVLPAQRFLGWVVIVLLLPMFTIGFIRSMVRRESNRVNAFTLITYTAVDTLLAYLLVGASLAGWGAILLFVAAVGLALAYNFRIMSFALSLEKE